MFHTLTLQLGGLSCNQVSVASLAVLHLKQLMQTRSDMRAAGIKFSHGTPAGAARKPRCDLALATASCISERIFLQCLILKKHNLTRAIDRVNQAKLVALGSGSSVR